MILGVCDNPEVLSTMRIIKITIQIIKIIVPIILMISIAMSYTQAIASKDEDAIKKAHQSMTKKLIAAAVIFLVPTLVGITAKLTYTNLEYMKCIAAANSAGIDDANYEQAESLIQKAKKSLSETDYKNAKVAIYKVQDTTKRNKLLAELNQVAKLINEKNKKKEEETKTPTTPTNPTGVPINLDTSFKVYSGGGTIPKYAFYVPKNPTTNLPLIVFMPANEYGMNELVRIFKNTKLQLPNAFMYIPTITFSGNWQKDLESQINDISTKYYINKNKISITGFSTGGWYMYYFTSAHQNMFAAIFPISVGHSYNSPTIQQNLNYYKTIPMRGYGESIGQYKPDGTQCGGWPAGWIASTQMGSLFKGLGRSNDFINVGPICHDKIFDYVFNLDTNKDNKIDVLEWAISQSR